MRRDYGGNTSKLIVDALKAYMYMFGCPYVNELLDSLSRLGELRSGQVVPLSWCRLKVKVTGETVVLVWTRRVDGMDCVGAYFWVVAGVEDGVIYEIGDHWSLYRVETTAVRIPRSRVEAMCMDRIKELGVWKGYNVG